LKRKGYFNEKIFGVLDWPPESPDLSPIEIDIYAIIKGKLFDRANEINSPE
jgi:hypothetical protein